MPFHVLTASFVHESNTFKKGETTLQDFRDDVLDIGQAAVDRFGDVNDELAGFLDTGREAGWRVTHAVSAHASPGARVSREAFEHVAGIICDAARIHRATLDGVALSLHGSMVPTFCEDGEGELLARLRAILGPDLPIAATLDLHAMVTPAMVERAQIFVSYKTYPHIDMREVGRHAGRLLDAAMRGVSCPRTLRAHRPMLDETNAGRTDVPQTAALYARASDCETEPGILAVSVNAGFSEADIAEMGPTVLVTHEECAAYRAREIAEELAHAIWECREQTASVFLSPQEAATIARDFGPSGGPLVIADYADNPGAGAYGDATSLLSALLEAGAKGGAFAPMIDPEAARELHLHEVGDIVRLAIGGKHDPSFGGGPLSLEGEIVHLSDGVYTGDGPILGGITHSFGPTAVFRVEGIDILVVTLPGQMLDLQQVRSFGIEPAQLRFLVVKSMQHFRAAFEPVAGRVIVCDTGALATPQAHLRSYTRVRRPVWPLDRSGFPAGL